MREISGFRSIENPLRGSNGYMYGHAGKLVHVEIAEIALGKPLPQGAEIHHVNGDRSDNRPENLVICESTAYHRLLHRRMDAYRATGDAEKLICQYCRNWDDAENLYVWRSSAGSKIYHRSCNAAYCYQIRYGHPKPAVTAAQTIEERTK